MPRSILSHAADIIAEILSFPPCVCVSLLDTGVCMYVCVC